MITLRNSANFSVKHITVMAGIKRRADAKVAPAAQHTKKQKIVSNKTSSSKPTVARPQEPASSEDDDADTAGSSSEGDPVAEEPTSASELEEVQDIKKSERSTTNGSKQSGKVDGDGKFKRK